MRDDAKVDVSFQPSGLSASVLRGTLITGAMLQAGILLPLDCGGNGTCGRCLVSVSGPVSSPSEAEKRLLDQQRLDQGWRLACQTQALGDLQVRVPETSESADSSWRIDEGDVGAVLTGTPVIVAVDRDIPQPTLEDPVAICAGCWRPWPLHKPRANWEPTWQPPPKYPAWPGSTPGTSGSFSAARKW